MIPFPLFRSGGPIPGKEFVYPCTGIAGDHVIAREYRLVGQIQAKLLADRKEDEIQIAEVQTQARKENDPQMIKAIEEEKRKLEATTKRLDRDNAGLQATVGELGRDNLRRLAAEVKSQQQLKAAEQRNARHLVESAPM